MTRALLAGGALALLGAPATASAQALRTPTEQPPEAPAQEAPAPEGAPAAKESAPAGPMHVDGWKLDLSRDSRRGARIESIDPSSPAAAMLQPGDVVTGADGARVHDAAALARALAAVPVGTPVLLDVVRGGRARLVGVQIPPEPGKAVSSNQSLPSLSPHVPPSPAESLAPSPPERAPRGFTPPVSLYPDVPAIPLPVPEPRQPTIVVVPSGGFGDLVLGGGGTETLTAVNPPAFSAPGLSIIPGATFPPGPGTPATAAPQLPGISQPPGFEVPLGSAPIAGPAGGPAPILGNATVVTPSGTNVIGSGSVPVAPLGGGMSGSGTGTAAAGLHAGGAVGHGGH